MNTIDVRLTDKQLEFLKKKAGRRSVTNELSDMVMQMLNGMMWMEEHKDEMSES